MESEGKNNAKKEKIGTQPYKGVRDFYPEDQTLLNYILATERDVCRRFGYEEYHASILEPAELYRGKGADNEEIINEQTYTFMDRGGREVTLRPEMTPTVARMLAARRRDLGFPLRLFSTPNLFRYEATQRGRLREHWQLNVDLFGSDSLAADAEIISIAHALFMAFGASQSDFVIKLGSRSYLNALAAELGLSEENTRAMFALLDRKDKMPQEKFEADMEAIGVPLGKISADNPPEDVAAVLTLLSESGIDNAVFDPSIVRGFAYYTGVVFEVYDTHPENKRALCGGGRYDNLTKLFDDERVPAVGFGLGDVTVGHFLEVRGLIPPYLPSTRVYLAVPSEVHVATVQALAHELRQQGVTVAIDFGEKKLSDQIRQASKHKIPYLIVVGDTEAQTGTFVVRNLATGSDTTLKREQLAPFFTTL
ncbi:MAG: hisS [Candidatus Adlerbacteria bacterium]|nr:hisS [Candidatus Adlerbacteria bacterium]